MKMTKRIFSLALCLVLMMALAVPAFAADPTYTLTINNDTGGHTYEAYQIFSGVLAHIDGKDKLSDIKWGSSVADPAALLEAIDDEPGLSALHGAVDAAALAVKLTGVTSDSETIDLFAEVVGPLLTNPAGEDDYDENKYEISGLGAGYYLIKDKDDSLSGEYDSYTKYIIHVLKTLTLTPKSNVPEVNKEINDTIDGTFTEHEDFDISDTAYYKWTATFPSNLKSYKKYAYNFYDTLPKGLQFTRFDQIYIEDDDGNLVHTIFDLHDTDTTNDTLPAGVAQALTPLADGQSKITLTFTDLLTLYPDLLASHELIVKYSCMVNRDALFSVAMTNSVYAEFSNNPNGDGDGQFGKTPPDTAHAFTFKITVDKYETDNVTKKLEGAEFVLYYEKVVGEKHYAKVITEEMVYALDAQGKPTATLKPEAERMLNGKAMNAVDVGVVYGWTTNRAEASILDTDSDGKLYVKGLDAGIYYLQETKAPAGYNLMETPVQINIIPTYNAEGELQSMSYEVDSVAQTSDVVGVRNSAGSTLPVTGGVGTTMFYIIGGLMVAAAVVLLITKRRVED